MRRCGRRGVIDRATAQAALELLEVDAHGFDELDRRLLRTIIEKYDGGPVGLNSGAEYAGGGAGGGAGCPGGGV